MGLAFPPASTPLSRSVPPTPSLGGPSHNLEIPWVALSSLLATSPFLSPDIVDFDPLCSGSKGPLHLTTSHLEKFQNHMPKHIDMHIGWVSNWVLNTSRGPPYITS